MTNALIIFVLDAIIEVYQVVINLFWVELVIPLFVFILDFTLPVHLLYINSFIFQLIFSE
jgi:hypothetical protein